MQTVVDVIAVAAVGLQMSKLHVDAAISMSISRPLMRLTGNTASRSRGLRGHVTHSGHA